MGAGEKPCTGQASAVFVIGLVAGTGCVIFSKTLFELKSEGLNGELLPFKPQVFQSWLMFFGMLFALPMYLGTEWLRARKARHDPALKAAMDAEPPVTVKTLLMLGLPAVFDLLSVLLMVAGLMHISASIWMLLRGGGIVFVALMKQFALGDRLTPAMWWGVGFIALAVTMVGLSPMLAEAPAPSEGDAAPAADSSGPLAGIALTIAGTFCQSLQYVYEEKVMAGDVQAPPWLLIGMEGFFGTLLCTLVVYPIAQIAPGPDHGVVESLPNTLLQIEHSQAIQQMALGFCVLVFILNSFSVLVTFMLSSVWHAILDNFRPITIWMCNLYIFHATDGAHGESWNSGSYLQLLGLGVMLYGTAVYNGSVKLPWSPDGENLLGSELFGGAASRMASPALARSPLLTGARLSPLGGAMATSPYAQAGRPALPLADPLLPAGR